MQVQINGEPQPEQIAEQAVAAKYSGLSTLARAIDDLKAGKDE